MKPSFDPVKFRFCVGDDVVAVRRPSAGYGGHEIIVSPDGSRAALFMYSGQSEQGWELYALAPKLRRLEGLPYVYGVGDPPVFSADSSRLAMAVAGEVRFIDHRGKAYDEIASDDILLKDQAKRSWVVTWATLWVQRLPKGTITRHAIRTLLRPKDDPLEWEAPTNLSFVETGAIRAKLPWRSKAVLELPRSGPILVPRAGPR